MTDRRPDDDEDHAWLLARERGEPGPSISEARARRYAQLGTLIADLPAVPGAVVQRTGWEQAVLAAIDAGVGQPGGQTRSPPLRGFEQPRPKPPKPTTRYRRRVATITAAALVMAAGVAIVLVVHRDRPQELPVGASAGDGDPAPAGRSGVPGPIPEVTRGLHVEPGRLGFDHALQVRRSETAVAHDIRDGDTVTTGDRIRASVRTSADAYLYLAFCASEHLQVYPSQRGVRTRAGDLMVVPEGGGELVVDDHPGSEVLYLIVSRNELSLADPQLAELVATSDTTSAVDCGASLDTRLMRSGGVPSTNVLRGERILKKRMPRSRGDSPEAPDLAGNPGDIVWYTADEASGPRAVAADASGIAVVRYRLLHVAPEHVDDAIKTKHD